MCRDHRCLPACQKQHRQNDPAGQADLSNARSLSSLFADPERILRRLYVFAEEPCKSTTTTSEPCSPVFKEVQPRPSEHSI